jgi:rsbT co-antagonist protein RsbR
MADNGPNRIADILERYESQLLSDWVGQQLVSDAIRPELIKESELRQEASEFLRLFREAAQSGNVSNVQRPEWQPVRDLLASLSRTRAVKGFTPSETAGFVFSLRQPLIGRLREALGEESGGVVFEEIDRASLLLDRLGLYTTEVYQKSRDEVILRQQEEMLELSTPVVKLWDGILAIPLIGTLDSARTQVIMESLLQAIVDTGSEVAIIDITGVPTVDTLVSQHLLKTVAAARLMGAECIISGIRPQIAQTIVHLGVDLSMVSTKSTLAEAFVLALRKTGRTLDRGQDAAVGTRDALLGVRNA